MYYNVTTKANDRSGYAFFNHSGIVAYNEDGTLKSNADVIYVTNETKNTVTSGFVFIEPASAFVSSRTPA